VISRINSPPGPEQLLRNRLFIGFPTEVITDIGADVNLLSFDLDDVIFHEGEPGDCLFLVVEGSVRISKMGRGGKQETLGFIQPGNFFGEMALIDGQPRSAQATAAETSVLGRIDSAAFARVLAAAPRDLHMTFLRSVVERLRGINSHFITELMRTERLSLVGTMANSIIHDLKNPIHVLQSCSELIATKTADPSILQFTGIMQKAVDNMMDMVQELLDFARGQSSLQLKRQSAKSVIDELDIQLVRFLPKNVHPIREIRYCDDISADVGRFVRVLLNLIKNSLEAMPNGGVLRIGLRQEGAHAIFRIGDTGCGIAADLQGQIFEPFVTYGKSKGTGLGMAIAKSVVEAHGGTIGLRSTVGIGTTVEITVPTLGIETLSQPDV
jgi:signal transduction histidine kinase